MITLRAICPGDRERMLDILTSEKVNKTYMLPDFPQRQDADPLFKRLMDMSITGSKYLRAIDLEGGLIGYINQVETEDKTIELGYVMHPDFHGKGYMTEALTIAMEEVFEMGWEQIITGAFSTNIASIRVMEKCNMTPIKKTDLIDYRGTTHICVYYKKCRSYKKLKYPCLVLDHDDTVVQTLKTLSYPFWCLELEQFRPGQTMTLSDYVQECYRWGFADMCREIFLFTDQELALEHKQWMAYIMENIPQPFPGIERIIHRQKQAGGQLFVVSHSHADNILRDYDALFGIRPDEIYGWERPRDQRKPNTFPLEDIMERYGYTPDEILVVDDMQLACQMAEPLGVKVAFAGWDDMGVPQQRKDMQSRCAFSFDSVEELEKFLFD